MADTKNEHASSDSETLELDASGLYCPEPVMMLHNKIRDMETGSLLRLTATDPSTSREFTTFFLYLGHDLFEQSQAEGCFIYVIRKNSG